MQRSAHVDARGVARGEERRVCGSRRRWGWSGGRSCPGRGCLSCQKPAEPAAPCARRGGWKCGLSPEPVPPPCRSGDSGQPPAQRVDKGDEAFRAGEYDTASELFRAALAGLAEPYRGLCLRLGDALARAGRLLECLGAFRGAARLGALRLDELVPGSQQLRKAQHSLPQSWVPAPGNAQSPSPPSDPWRRLRLPAGSG